MRAPLPRSLRLCCAVVLLAFALGAVSCSSQDGRELAEPDPQLTATTPPTTAPAPTLASFLTLTSPAFDISANLPARFTCDGADVSPPLTISDVPADADTLVVSLTDPDADGFVHWAMADIAPTTTNLGAGEVPPGAVIYPNDFGNRDYDGPCPPEGEPHDYLFTVYVLAPSAVEFVGPDETNGAGLLDTVSRLATTSAAVTVTYRREG